MKTLLLALLMTLSSVSMAGSQIIVCDPYTGQCEMILITDDGVAID